MERTRPPDRAAPILALAHSAGAWLVTGNLRHFPPPIREGVTVMAPAPFLARLTGEPGR